MSQKSIREILKVVQTLEIRSRRMAEEVFAGQYHSAFRGSGIDFDEVREYVPGDDVRSIDWNVTARSGRIFIKKYQEEREQTFLLMIDVSGSGDFGSTGRSKREVAAELASVLAFSAIRNRDRVGLLLFTDRVELIVPPRRGRSHVLRLIREILFFEPLGRGTRPVVAIDAVSHLLKRRSVIFLMSDFLGAGCESAELVALKPKLNSLNRKHDLVAVSVLDPREEELFPAGLLTLEDAETGELREVDTGREAVRSVYRQSFEGQRAQMRRVFRQAGIDGVELRTDQSYMPVMRQFFKLRERRRR